MKGLVIKDLMCMKKQLIIFCYVVFAVFIVSIMYMLSARFGNIALAAQQLKAQEDMANIDIVSVTNMAIGFFMLLPLAVMCDFTIIFREDHKAGFANVSASLPLPIWQRVLAKYITVIVLFALGCVVDIVIGGVLACLTDTLQFVDFICVILSAVSIMSIFSCLVVFFCLLLEGGNEEHATIFSLLVMVSMLVLINIKKIKNIILMILSESDVPDEILVPDIFGFFRNKTLILVVTAAVIMVLSYAGSYLIATRKRGVL